MSFENVFALRILGSCTETSLSYVSPHPKNALPFESVFRASGLYILSPILILMRLTGSIFSPSNLLSRHSVKLKN